MVTVSARVDGDVRALVDAARVDVADAFREAVVNTAGKVHADMRTQTRAAGLGRGLENAWRAQVYPKSEANKTLHPAGLVHSKAVVLHDAFIAGATITARRGRYLVIPTAEAEAMGFATTREARDPTKRVPAGQLRRAAQYRAAIAKLGAENIRDIPLPNGRRLIVYQVPQGRGKGRVFRGPRLTRVGFRRGQDVPLFILIPQVRLAPRLDLNAAKARAETTFVRALDTSLARVTE